MSLLTRRIIFYLTLGVFLIAAPTTIFYTAGFRYNFKQKRVVKTGAIAVSSDPRNAEVFLNGRLRAERTPARLLNLTPGDYAVRIAKDGYIPWQKTLSVESAQVTFAETVTLFKRAAPKRAAEGSVVDVIHEPGGDGLLFIRQEGSLYEIWKQENERRDLIWRSALKSEPKFLEWSPKRNEALLRADEYLILDMDPPGPELKTLSALTGKSWDALAYGKNHALFFGVSGGALYSINPNTGAADVIDKDVEGFFAAPNEIYVSKKEGEETAIALLRGATANVIARLPGGAWTWIEARDPWLILTDLKREKIAIVNSKTGEVSETDGSRVVWLPEETPSFLSATDFEIRRYEPETKKTELLTRLGEPIRDVVTRGLKDAFLVVTDRAVSALELDTRGRQNTYDLAEFLSIKSAKLNAAGNVLYLAALDSSGPGLWRLDIR